MAHSAKNGAFKAAHTAKTEIMPLPLYKVCRHPGFSCIRIKQPAVCVGNGCTGTGLPDDSRQDCLHEIGNPIECRQGIHYCYAWHFNRHPASFRQRFYFNGKVTEIMQVFNMLVSWQMRSQGSNDSSFIRCQDLIFRLLKK